jgi:hypothetical protein
VLLMAMLVLLRHRVSYTAPQRLVCGVHVHRWWSSSWGRARSCTAQSTLRRWLRRTQWRWWACSAASPRPPSCLTSPRHVRERCSRRGEARWRRGGRMHASPVR